MNIITIKQPTNSNKPLQDYLAVLPKKYEEGDLFRLEKSDVYCEYYKGKNKQIGVKLYSPEYLDGKLVKHKVIRIQPNGKLKQTGIKVELPLPKEEVKEAKDIKAEKTVKPRKPLYIAPKLKTYVKPIRKGTKQEKIANLLVSGATVEELIKATNWTKASVKSALHEDMHNRKGYGIKQDEDKYFLIFPEGINQIVLQGS